MIKFLCILIILLATVPKSLSALKGTLEYQIPIDYTKLSQEEIENKAEFYYKMTMEEFETHLSSKLTQENPVSPNMTQTLNLYIILTNKCPTNSFYKTRLGFLYDIIGKDDLAKSYYMQAIGINKELPDSYHNLGEFYYKRAMYKKALKYYKEAYKKGYSDNYNTLLRIGDIYQKFGDTEAALIYLECAYQNRPNTELYTRIKKIKDLNQSNSAFYSNTRIQLIER